MKMSDIFDGMQPRGKGTPIDNALDKISNEIDNLSKIIKDSIN